MENRPAQQPAVDTAQNYYVYHEGKPTQQIRLMSPVTIEALGGEQKSGWRKMTQQETNDYLANADNKQNAVRTSQTAQSDGQFAIERLAIPKNTDPKEAVKGASIDSNPDDDDQDTANFDKQPENIDYKAEYEKLLKQQQQKKQETEQDQYRQKYLDLQKEISQDADNKSAINTGFERGHIQNSDEADRKLIESQNAITDNSDAPGRKVDPADAEKAVANAQKQADAVNAENEKNGDTQQQQLDTFLDNVKQGTESDEVKDQPKEGDETPAPQTTGRGRNQRPATTLADAKNDAKAE